MGTFKTSLDSRAMAFIRKQALFFVATAPTNGHVNLSPKGFNTFRVIDQNTVAYLDLTGSGNETAAHILENGRITLMFCAFEGKANILRLYGKGRIVLPTMPEWGEWIAHFKEIPGTRQIFVITIDRVSNSCGFGIPIYQIQEERPDLIDWAEKLGPARLEKYRAHTNSTSIDGLPTGIAKK